MIRWPESWAVLVLFEIQNELLSIISMNFGFKGFVAIPIWRRPRHGISVCMISMKYIDGQRFVLMLLYERWQDFKCHLHYSLSVVLGDAMKWAVCELTSASFHRAHFITQWFNIFIAWEDYTIIIDVSLLLIHLLYKLFLGELICNLNGKQNHASEENHVKSC